MSRARILADYVSSGDELADTVPASGGTFSGVATFNSDIKAGTIKANDGTAAITIADSTGVVTIADLTVSGTETILNTTTVEVEDNILQLNTTQASPDTATAATSGISVYRGNGVTQASLVFDDADDTWDLTNNLVVAGDVFPSADNTTDLGSAAKRWRNIYTTDLHLNNDRGDWTIIEEEEYLSIRNNKNGKMYKFVLEEIE